MVQRVRPRLASVAGKVGTLDIRTAKPSAKEANALYLSPAWRTLITQLVKERGRRCQDPRCKQPHRTGIRVFGDHIVELADGGQLLDPMNVMLRCGSCHTRKTNEARERRFAGRSDPPGGSISGA